MITIYSWALLIIGFLVVVAYILIFSNSTTSYLAPTCIIQPQLPCLDAGVFTANTIRPVSYFILFQNQLQTPMTMGANAFNVITTGIGQQGVLYTLGNCNPAIVLPGAESFCNVSITSGSLTPSVGTSTQVNFVLSYGLCQPTSFSSCSSNTAYKTSGSSVQPISAGSPQFGLHALTLNVVLWIDNTIVTYGGGNVLKNYNSTAVIDGVSYSTGKVFLINGSYSLYGMLGVASNSAFGEWNIINPSGGTTVVGSVTGLNTTLYVASNATINVTYTTAKCSPYINWMGPSGGGSAWGYPIVCPYTCPFVQKVGGSQYYCQLT